MPTISVVIPTLDRPLPLRRAITSILAQKLPADLDLEVIVVDNSRDMSARVQVEDMAKAAHNLKWMSEPRPGVSNARNAGVRKASGSWIAFLDDDEEAAPNWIASLVAVANSTKADAVFGPISAKAEGGEAINEFASYFSRELKRPDEADITDNAAYLGTNNSFFDRSRCFDQDESFDPRLNGTGGEDSLLLKRLVLRGRRFAWASGAQVIEWVPPRRLNWAYIRKRKFLSGQIRVFVHHMINPVQWLPIGFWMAVGGLQCAAGATAALVLTPIDRTAAERARVVCAAGLGKLLWMPRFRPALYGQGHVS